MNYIIMQRLMIILLMIIYNGLRFVGSTTEKNDKDYSLVKKIYHRVHLNLKRSAATYTDVFKWVKRLNRGGKHI